jgi:GNAT superfamily N-acetyltransferase
MNINPSSTFINPHQPYQPSSTLSTLNKMTVALQPATVHDIPLIRDLAHRIWWAHYPEIISNEQIAYMLEQGYSEAALTNQISDSAQTFWLVLADGIAAGFLAISDKSAGAYFIHKFYLDNTQRGRGVGAAAFQSILEQYPDVQEIRLNVNRRNYKSVNFYFKVGFIIDHCMDTPFGAGYIMDDFQMLYRAEKK